MNGINLKDLKKRLPYKWRVQSVSKFKPQATCVAYIDARDAMDLLDEVVGPGNWQDTYEFRGNILFAKVGIKVNDEWVWKEDTGNETDIEADKGHVSDSFKRACVKWGIGRFLYSMEMRYVATNEKKEGNNRPYPVDNNGKRIWDLTKHFEGTAQRVEQVSTQPMSTTPVAVKATVKSVQTPQTDELQSYLSSAVPEFGGSTAPTQEEAPKQKATVRKIKKSCVNCKAEYTKIISGIAKTGNPYQMQTCDACNHKKFI